MGAEYRANKKRKLERRLDDEYFPIIGKDVEQKTSNKKTVIIFSDEK